MQINVNKDYSLNKHVDLMCLYCHSKYNFNSDQEDAVIHTLHDGTAHSFLTQTHPTLVWRSFRLLCTLLSLLASDDEPLPIHENPVTMKIPNELIVERRATLINGFDQRQ